MTAIAMPIEPTTDQLDAAWHELRRRGYGSCLAVATLADALAAPIAGRLVRLHAGLAAAGVRTFGACRVRPAMVAPEPPEAADRDAPPAVRPGLLPRERRKAVPRRRPAPALHVPSLPADHVDRKSLAAGERDD